MQSLTLIQHIQLLRLELKIHSNKCYEVDQVHKCLSRVCRDTLEYLQSEEAITQDYLGGGLSSRRKQKGLWYFRQDILLQMILHIVGLFFELRGNNHLENIVQARNYYLLSISCPLLEQVELGLMKKSLQRFSRISRVRVTGSPNVNFQIHNQIKKCSSHFLCLQ
ncbi:hypothetical protein FGO68_gene17522 [Halteria grandinella]|uniref:Uncharacterized protein n=1 Tax=Halteria grandinella TaxID=5974 RepID=A0A8J8P5G7_HALGN|nr:hypothetical protein FGO68_gene17522 [Halteria grandinella]